MENKEIRYSVPVLTVQSDGKDVVPGSGKLQECPFSYLETGAASSVKVSIIEDMPSGTGNSLRASLWLAIATATMLEDRTLTGAVINFETSGCVDGPSAGGMLCLAVMSALEDREFPRDFAMTGTIMIDGTVGAVGGVGEKIFAASKAGIKRMCIPASVRMDEHFNDLLEIGKQCNIEIHQVSSISEAFRVLHELPPSQAERLNPVDVCRLPPHFESVLKTHFHGFLFDCPLDSKLWNYENNRSVAEYSAGLFGAAADSMIDALGQYSIETYRVMTPPADRYPHLSCELELTDEANPEQSQIKAQYVDELIAYHRELLEIEEHINQRMRDEAADEIAEIKQNVSHAVAPDDEARELWQDDFVESPCASQLVTYATRAKMEKTVYELLCRNITEGINAIQDWSVLDCETLNKIRQDLMRKEGLISHTMSYRKGGEQLARMNRLQQAMEDAVPYFRCNSNVSQIEQVFYRTLKAVDASLTSAGVDEDDSTLSITYWLVQGEAERHHSTATDDVERLKAIFFEIEALSYGCALMLRLSGSDLSSNFLNPSVFCSVIEAARERALNNISACRKRGIPCVAPVLLFEEAESDRFNNSVDMDVDVMWLDVFSDYLQASLCAKALVLCFDGGTCELNAKGYCCKKVSWYVNDHENMTVVQYLGTDGEPILRKGFSGYQFRYTDGNLSNIGWLDIKGREVRFRNASMSGISEFDEAGRQIGLTYCDESWCAKVRDDGVLSAKNGYDERGNRNLIEVFGAGGKRILNSDGYAIARMVYDDFGREIKRRYFGIQGEPVLIVDGFAGQDWVYDANGLLRRIIYVGCDERPVDSRLGFAFEELKYNSQGLENERSWYDRKGNLVPVEGVAQKRFRYDERGNLILIANFDAEGRPVRDVTNVSVVQYFFNQSGEPVEGRFYGPDGEPTLHSDGNASWRAVADAAGRIVGRKYYDLNGEEINIR